jgi:CubicO group peptidase (beta-lactamase class C family)
MAGSGALEAAAERLEGFVRSRLALPGLAVGLIGPGGWRHEFAAGVSDVASGRPLAPDALLPVASMGKMLTAVALFREQEEGRLELDAPVHRYLPWLPLATPFGPITVRHLLGHTAGIVTGLDGSPSPAGEALALAHTPPGWPPGERSRYSNVGYAVLGLVLERVAGCTYAEALQRHVLGPCAMTGSEAVTTADAQARAATGHVELAGGALVPAPWTPNAAGSGATLCTTADFGRFLRALLAGDPPLLRPATRQAMLAPALPIPENKGYGYGLGVEIDVTAGYPIVGHQGDAPGYAADAFGDPETGVAVAALGNGPWLPPSSPGSTFEAVSHGIALLRAAALGQDLPPDPAPAAPEPPGDQEPPAPTPAGDGLPAELAALTGTYAAWNPWMPQVRVLPAAGGGLALEWPDGDIVPLVPLPGGGFRFGADPASPERAAFEAEVEGRPLRVVLSGWPYDRVD